MLDLKRCDAAGGLTIDEKERVLFIFKDGRWDLPKGIIEGKRGAADTALAEVSEETGLPIGRLSVLSELIPTSHISKYKKKRFLKVTRWFLIKYKGKEEAFAPQTDEGIEHCRWIPIWELDLPLGNCPARVSYLVQFWLKARELIKSKKA